MAFAPQCSLAGAVASLNAMTALLNKTNSTSSIIKIFTGSPPANTEAADSGTLLSEGMTLSDTAFADATSVLTGGSRGATASANSIGSDTAAAAGGTAGYYRAYYWSGSAWVCVFQGTCGTSDTDMILNTTSIIEGATVACSAWSVNLPDGG
jgi:hypothetical protein